MAHSAKEVLNKVGDLLVEINEEYVSIKQQEQQHDVIKLGLLIAKAKYLTAHLEVLGQISSQPVASIAAPIDKEETEFTPPSPIVDEEIDSQPVYEEIIEVDQVVEEANDSDEYNNDLVVEEVEEDTVSQGSFNDTYEEEEISEVQHEEDGQEDGVDAERVEDTHVDSVEAENFASFENQSTVGTPTEQPEQKVLHNDSQPETVVNQVVEEQREVAVDPKPVVEEEIKPSRPLTLNEIIQQQKKAGLTNANQFSTSASKTDQILDLKAAVSLNDKLLFIKDLFNGYSLAYTEAIELLNRFDNFEEADAFLQANYALKNNWNAKPQTVDKLYAILRKKFG